MQEDPGRPCRTGSAPRHELVLLAARTIAVALRKLGRLEEALVQSREHYLQCQGTYGPDHQHTLAGAMTYANAMRAMGGQETSAWNQATEAVAKYRKRFGARNPLTLAAAVNQAAIARAMGEGRKARQLDEMTCNYLTTELGERHPYTLAASVGLANDLILAHEDGPARSVLERTLEHMRQVRGLEHPETLTCAINLGLVRLAGGDPTGRARSTTASRRCGRRSARSPAGSGGGGGVGAASATSSRRRPNMRGTDVVRRRGVVG